ncbi:MAG: hypothetical protein HWN66_11920 [Candidatus Helarchaeota archaeon]|nr:hypothetical protein [Candidatus Helarchaeota archaeon]
MTSMIGDIMSIGFIIVLILLSSTFSITLINRNHRRTFKIITAILIVVALGFMVMFVLGIFVFPEPV